MDVLFFVGLVGVHIGLATSAMKWLIIPSARLAARSRPASSRRFVRPNQTAVASSAAP
jgi:hypothetical protein